MLSAAGIEHREIPAVSKHPYPHRYCPGYGFLASLGMTRR